MLTLFSFLLALGVLIAIHEYGHYRVAVACGVKVLRFSIGMGKPLLSWRRPGSDTEFVIAALPLGGYVRMLDEREGDVPADQLHQAFNRQPLRKRAAIVAAGPLANLLLAAALYSTVNWVGQEQPKAIVSVPERGSLASQIGLKGGELVHTVQQGQAPQQTVESFEDLRWHVTRSTLHAQDLRIFWTDADGRGAGQGVLELSGLAGRELDPHMFARIGISLPWMSPVMGEVMADTPAARAGLQPDDTVQTVNGQRVTATQLRDLIRDAAQAGSVPQTWVVERQSRLHTLAVTPELVSAEDGPVGRIGAYIAGSPDMVTVRKNAWDGLAAGVVRTWDVSVLSVQMIGKMLVGEASLKNLSGPLTIADYAGKSASSGWVQYLLFLALISVSLGVLNLLPLPVLDGGHLMYYLWEGVTGRPVSDTWMERLQRAGIGLLLVMMTIAFFNDISRIWGSITAVL